MLGNRFSTRHVVVLSALFLFSSVTFGQVTNVTNDQSTPIQGAGHDYIKMLGETVNPANGSVSLRIQLPVPNGRLLTNPIGFAHDTNGVHHLTTDPNGAPVWAVDVTPYSRGGWSYSVPTVSYIYGTKIVANGTNQSTCEYYSAFVFQDPGGGRHALGLSSAEPYTAGACLYPATAVPNAGDDYYRASTLPTFATPNAKVASPDGTVYSFSCAPSCNPSTSGDAMIANTIEDRNGNTITSTTNSKGGYTFTDTLGRTVVSSSSFASSTGDTISVSGLPGSFTVTWKTVTANFTTPTEVLSSQGCPIPTNTDQRSVISSITLPNGEQYTFLYGTDDPANSNPYGLLSKITYPSGAWVKYSYGLNTLSDVFNTSITVVNHGVPSTYSCIFLYATPALTQRTVSFDGVNVALQQAYTYSTTWNSILWTSKQTKVVTTDEVTGQPFETDYAYSSFIVGNPPNLVGGAANQVPLEQTVTYKGTTGSVLRTSTKGWIDQYLLNCQLKTLDNGLISGTYYTYGSGAQITDKKEYDYNIITSPSSCQNGSTAPAGATRETAVAYQTFASTPIFPTNPSIFDRPTSIITYGSGTRIAETDYSYDQTGVGSVSNLPSGTHDETNYSPNYNSRGNATTIVRQCLQTCTNSVSKYTFDETGQVLTKLDPCGNATCADMTGTSHTTQYSYANSYTVLSGGQNESYTPSANTDAYLTNITNSLGQTQNFTYDYNNGQLTASKDQNAQTTTYLYNDTFARPTVINYPDGGQTSVVYNDAPYNSSTPSPSATTTKLGNPSPNLTTLTAFDGMGHTVRSVLTSDPDCASGDRTDTVYDGLGRVHTVSNPYCTTGDLTYGLTTYAYDALGRNTQVTHPDSTTVLTTYAGRAIQVQDEGNGNGTQRVTRISQINGLGQLASVCEVSNATLVGQSSAPAACGQDITGTGFATSYLYDGLSSLKQVTQGTMTPRTFAYDSLSRLISVSNPESGTTTYSYDANDNLFAKTGPAPNQTGTATVTTSYQYDSLNRNTQKSYSDGTTPAATFLYDSATAAYGDSVPYPIGRLVQATTGCTFTINRYDVMGRIAAQIQQLPTTNCNNLGPPLVLNYSYDLLGDITSSTNGEFDTFTYVYNGAARLKSLTSSYSDLPYYPPNLLSAATYNAFGRIVSDTLGDTENESWTYDNRMRLQSSNSLYNGLSLYSYSLTFAPNSDVLTANDSVNGNWTYAYDAFNRLACSNLATNGTCASPSNGTPTYTYVYDRFGNRWQQNGPNSMQLTFTGNSPGSPQNNNRVDGYSYDAAGNMLADTLHTYAYDAENRLIQVDAGGTAAYSYDAFGRRVVKTTGAAIFNECDPSNTTGGSVYYLYDLAGRAGVYTANGTTNMCHDEIYAGNRHLVTYEGQATFVHADWLGTERTRISYNYINQRNYDQHYTSLPFGDALSGFVGPYESPLHFTGKERDYESGLDDFGARYLGSSMGRFMSPDWSEKPMGVPYAEFGDPQSLNLYAYVRNNPVSRTDPNGHWCWWGFGNSCNTAPPPPPAPDPANIHSNPPPPPPPKPPAQQTSAGNGGNSGQTTVRVSPFGNTVLQAGVSVGIASPSVSYVPSTGNIYVTPAVGNPTLGLFAGGGSTTNLDQSGPAISAAGFAGIGGGGSYFPMTGDTTTLFGLGTPGPSLSAGWTLPLFSVPPATFNVNLPAIDAVSAVQMSEGLTTYYDWPQQ
jgi:RHS repeat-associated protein